MKPKFLSLFLPLLMLAVAATSAGAQDERFTAMQQPVYLTDANGKPWSDLTCQLRVKLDSEYTKDLGADEIGIEKPPTRFSSGTWKLYNLEQDSNGTFARVNWVVLKNSNDPVVYQIGLYNPATKTEVPWLRKGSSRMMMRNNVPPQTVPTALANSWASVFRNNWVMLAVFTAAGLLLAYILWLRFLFVALLKKNWGASSAQYVTWVLTLATLLGGIAAWHYYNLGPRLETWITLGLTGVTVLLLGVVLAVSGRYQS
ncbi:MAG: hypothetical protein QOH49_403 [Acidobacteriota bacterium]|jgi:hypothetical protein|nr:hypothetical protein [Acidobacteriota bacterium]